MNTFLTVSHLEDVLQHAKDHGSILDSDILYRHAQPQPVTLAYSVGTIRIPTLVPAREVERVRYTRRHLSAFRHSRELCGEAGMGWYGIGLYEERSDRTWWCNSILFDENRPLLIKTRDAAQARITLEVQTRDQGSARTNEDTLRKTGLIDSATLHVILATLTRPETKATSVLIAARDGRIRVLLSDEDGGRELRAKFICRDDAAGYLLEQIAYEIDDAHRAAQHGETRCATGGRDFELT